MIAHIRAKHLGLSNYSANHLKYECYVCLKLFWHENLWKKHIATHKKSTFIDPLWVYIPKQNLKCTQCDKLYNSLKDFEKQYGLVEKSFLVSHIPEST